MEAPSLTSETIGKIPRMTEIPGITTPIKVHNAGHIMLESWMGSDLTIVQNARVSFDQASDEMGTREIGLINFLMREKHGTPFESVVLRFDVKAPIFVFREWVRHRISSTNEQSARYSKIDPEFYVPQREYIRHQVGKPGAYSFEMMENEEQAFRVISRLQHKQMDAYKLYESLLEEGVAKEVARICLPVGTYSRMKWTVNLRSLLNFLSLRNSDHAQREIRDYAVHIESLLENVVPVTMSAFRDHGRTCP